MSHKKAVFADPSYQAVKFDLKWEGQAITCIGFIYSYLVEEFNKPETLPMKRLMMCNVAINSNTGKLIKNAYEGRY